MNTEFAPPVTLNQPADVTVPHFTSSSFPLHEKLAVSIFQQSVSPLWSHRELPLDFDLTVSRTPDGWIVSDRPSGVFGSGDTFPGALADFHAAVAEHVDVLKRQSALSAALREQLQYLRLRIRR